MNTILKVEGIIIGFLIILYMLGRLAYMGMELDMIAYDYEYHEYFHSEDRNELDEN